MNIADHLEQGAREHPDRAAILFEGRRISYAALDRDSGLCAAALHRLGARAGDRIALFLPNIPEFATAYLGAMKLGAACVSVSSAFKSEELEYILRDSRARVLFTSAAMAKELASARANCPELSQLISCEGALPDAPALAALLAAEPSPLRAEPRDADDDAALLYTSGTTGHPKGAVLTHGNVASNARAAARSTGMSGRDVLHLFLPLFHCFGQNFILNGGLSAGATIALHRRFDPEECLRAVRELGVTMFFAVPTIYIGFLDRGSSREQLASVRYYFSAAATMPVEVAERWRERFGIAIHEGYGLTETSPFAAYNHAREYRPGSIGTPIDGVQMCVVDAEDRPVAAGAWGEILIRGPNVMKGYFGKEEATREALRGGWFHSGDIGYVDADGYYYLVDRVKDMINAAGFKIWPREVEEVLYRHPAVQEAVVVGVPDRVKGERVKAVLICRPGCAVDPEEVIAFCRERIAAYKVPSEVELVQELPKSPTGKILKRVLRDRARAQAQ